MGKNEGRKKLFKADSGHGITEKSKRFLEKHMKKRNWETVKTVLLNRKDPKNTVWIFCENGDQFRVSGFNWGFGGEGPHGLLWFFKKASIPLTIENIVKLNMEHLYLIRKEVRGSWEISERSRWYVGKEGKC